MQDDNTPQELGRTENIGNDEGLKHAFETQLTYETIASVSAYAKTRAQWVQTKMKRTDELLARELYQDAVTDTWLKKVVWDPMKRPLELHLKRTIRSRSASMMKHWRRFPPIRLTKLPLDLEHEMSEAMEVEHDPELTSYVDDVVGRLYALAVDDAEVIKILDCYARGQSDRRDVVRATGLDSTTYHNARRRLVRLVERLPNDLREQAIRAMA